MILTTLCSHLIHAQIGTHCSHLIHVHIVVTSSMPTLVSNAHIGTHCTPHEKNSIVKNYSETPLPALIKEVHTSHYIKYIMYIVIYKNEYPCMCVTKQWIPLHVCIAKMNIIHVCNTTTNTIHACFTTANAICVGLARTVHVRIYTPYVW